MFTKGSKLYSILTGTCPRCQEESMYLNNNPYNIGDTMKMHENCSRCGLRYKVEPNFFFGAMYVSYAVAVFIGILVFLLCFFAFNTGMITSFIAIMITLILLMPWISRVSRNIYINIFVEYDPNAIDKKVS